MIRQEIKEIALFLNLGNIDNIEEIKGSRNNNFIVSIASKRYLFKFYNEAKRGDGSTEILAINRLKQFTYIKPVIIAHDRYLVTQFVDGVLLKDSEFDTQFSDLEIDYVTLQVVSFIRSCIRFDGIKFGRILPDGASSYESWGEYLFSYIDSLLQRAERAPSSYRDKLARHIQELITFFHSQKAFLNAVKSRFVPVDLNLSNFIVKEQFQLITIDLESFWHADPLLAYGDWMGNTYLTKLFQSFSFHWGKLSPVEVKIVHAYALLSNLGALVYMAEYTDDDLAQAKPWGNSHTYFELIECHREYIKPQDYAILDSKC